MTMTQTGPFSHASGFAGGRSSSASPSSIPVLTDTLYPKRSIWARYGNRYFALWYFGTLLTLWNIAGQWFIGFECSALQLCVGVGSAGVAQWLLDRVDAWSRGVAPRFRGDAIDRMTFFIPALIPGLAVAMLTYPNERIAPTAFAAVLAIVSKVLLRAPINGGTQHVFNPSNIAITLTLVLIPSVGLAPPYQFTENLNGWQNWTLVGVVLASGIVVHACFTGRLVLCLAWLSGFAVQALARAWAFDLPLTALFAPMTSAAFVLFTLYMIPDPATTPLSKSGQAAFGLCVAALYAVVLNLHVVFGLFFALAGTSALRGAWLYLDHWRALRRSRASSATPAPVMSDFAVPATGQ